VLAVGVGVGLGLAAGFLTRAALARLHLAAPETTVTLAVPFVAYLLADRLGGSGVLAVLTLGLYLRTYGHGAITSGGWLLGRAVWRYADYIVTSMVFVFIGFELTAVLEAEPLESGSIALSTATVLRGPRSRSTMAAPARTARHRRAVASGPGPSRTTHSISSGPGRKLVSWIRVLPRSPSQRRGPLVAGEPSSRRRANIGHSTSSGRK